jgi:hypothetical protein
VLRKAENEYASSQTCQHRKRIRDQGKGECTLAKLDPRTLLFRAEVLEHSHGAGTGQNDQRGGRKQSER